MYGKDLAKAVIFLLLVYCLLLLPLCFLFAAWSLFCDVKFSVLFVLTRQGLVDIAISLVSVQPPVYQNNKIFCIQ